MLAGDTQTGLGHTPGRSASIAIKHGIGFFVASAPAATLVKKDGSYPKVPLKNNTVVVNVGQKNTTPTL